MFQLEDIHKIGLFSGVIKWQKDVVSRSKQRLSLELKIAANVKALFVFIVTYFDR